MIINATITLTNIDIDLLRQQKQEMLTIPSQAVTTEQFGALAGVLNFLDSVQDQIVASGAATEDEVFGAPDDTVTELEQYAQG